MGVEYLPIQCNLSIVLETALHIGTGLGLGQILDDLTVQGPHPDVSGTDLPYIPGSSLKGRLRYHTRQLCAILLPKVRNEVEAHLFGFDDRPGGLVFADMHLIPTELARGLVNETALVSLFARSERSFVSLSRQRRVALEERLFRIDLAERGLTFTTTIRGNLPKVTVDRDLGLLMAAARDLTHLGGHKGRGLGKCRAEIGDVRISGQSTNWRALVEKL